MNLKPSNPNYSKWLSDIHDMHEKFGAKEWVDHKFAMKNFKTLNDFLAFRLDFLEEEFEETQMAFLKKDPTEVVDGLIDLIVIAIGTLQLFDCDADLAWNEVLRANMEKEPGANKSRKNPFGLPDMNKPEGWKGPEYHAGHVGMLTEIFKNEKERIQTLREKRDLENELKGQVANSQYE